MTVLDSTPRDQYTASGGQTVFTYTFEIAAAGDIKVLQNGTLINQGAGAGEYAVSGVGVDTGGNVTLVTGATAGDILTIYRDMALERLTAYTNAGDFLAADVNNDFDRLWLALQQNGGDLDGRVLIAPNTDPTGIDMTIPDKATRLDKYLKFNVTTGNPEVADPTALFAYAGLNHYNFTGDGTTVNFTLGMVPGGENNTQVYIDGVYQQKNTYNVSGAIVQFSAAPPSLSTIEVMVIEVLPIGSTTASQVSFTQAGSTYGRNVQLKLQESVSVTDFGAIGDGVTDDTAAFNRVIAAVNAQGANGIYTGDGTRITIPRGTYKLLTGLDPITVDGVHWVGDGLDVTFISAQAGTLFLFGGVSLVDSVSVRDMSVVCDSALTPSDTLTVLKAVHATRITIDNIKLIRVPKLFLGVAASGKLISNIKISNIVGETYNAPTGEALIECDLATGGSGAGLYLDSIRTNLKGVANVPETDGTVASTANAGCTAIYIHGLWDTVVASDCVFNRYYKGIHVVPNTSQTCSNMYFNQCIFDYCAENGVHLNNASGNTTKFRFLGGWLNATEGDTVSIERTGGLVDSITFKGCDFLNAGLNNIDIAASCTNITIEDNTFFACGRKQLTGASPTKTSNTINVALGCDGLSIEGNKCVDGFIYYGAGGGDGVTNQGTWNATTNTPALASGVGTQGDYYVVSVAGTTNLDGETDWGVGVWAVFTGGVWVRAFPLASGDYDGANGIELANIAMGFVITNNIMRGATAAYGFTPAELFATGNTKGRYIQGNTIPDGTVPEYIGISTAAVPASTVSETNLTGCQMMVYVRSGTVTSVKSNGNPVLSDTNTAVTIDPGANWSCTYSVAPAVVRQLLN